MHFRVKEIQGAAYIVRAFDNKLKLEIGDFFYPEEVSTLQLDGTLIYWNDSTGETFTVGASPVTTETVPEAITKSAVKPAEKPASK